LLVTDCYEQRGRPSTEAEDHLSLIFLLGNLASCIAVLLVGYLGDKIRLWKLFTAVNLLLLISYSILLRQIRSNSCTLPKLFDLAFILINGLNICTFIVSLILISKLCNSQTRGVMFAVSSLVGSLGTLIIQYVGGKVYDSISKEGPFWIGFWAYVLTGGLALGLGLAGKVRV